LRYLATDGAKGAPEKNLIEFTPREQHVFAELELGLPNKLIAAKLNLSENTVKMHIQHIMRKCSASNRTEAVLRWSGRLNGKGSTRESPDLAAALRSPSRSAQSS
jgi:DNA-binding NarL/FixJ family response regulator